MKDKFTVEDMAQMFYTKREQAHILGIHPSTWQNNLNNPHWPSTQRYMQKLNQHIRRELEHICNSTAYPETRTWVIATLKYMNTMALIDQDDPPIGIAERYDATVRENNDS